MAKIIIDIDDKTYKAFMEVISINLGRSNYKGIIEKCLSAIKHGKVLSKGHGRLIDASNIMTVTDYDGENEKTYIPYDEIENAPTIIEADKGDGGNDG